MAIYDRYLLTHPWLAMAVGSDLNVYGPAQARRYTSAWTGDRAKDLLGNRSKRVLVEHPALAKANRLGLGGREFALRPLTRTEMRMAGCELTEPPGGDDRRLVQTYARDTGNVLTLVTVPIYIHGERWGAANIGWDPDAIAH
jgi:hypothetical protein